MRAMRAVIAVVMVCAGTAACGSSQPAETPAATPAPAASEPQAEATSISGKPLVPITLPEAERARLEANLKAAEEELAKNPDSADALIWVGRRQGYLWRYRDAIATFTKGIEKFPNDARFYRHRGHRNITVRNFDGAVADFDAFDHADDCIRRRIDDVDVVAGAIRLDDADLLLR